MLTYMCYTTNNTSSDYHRWMNSELSLRWLTTPLLPSRSEPSVSALDNAPYNSELKNKSHCPTTITKKTDFMALLEHRKLVILHGVTQPELLLLSQQSRPKSQYNMENTIRQWGHDFVRLSPAHPELNAIEQVWDYMKHYVFSSLHRFTLADLHSGSAPLRKCGWLQLEWQGTLKDAAGPLVISTNL